MLLWLPCAPRVRAPQQLLQCHARQSCLRSPLATLSSPPPAQNTPASGSAAGFDDEGEEDESEIGEAGEESELGEEGEEGDGEEDMDGYPASMIDADDDE